MNPVLICTDTNRITQEKKFLDASIAIFQGVYDALAALNVPVTLTEISNLLQWSLNSNHKSDFTQEFVINKLLDAAAPYTLNGVELNREAVKGMLAVPDVSTVKQEFAPYINLMRNYDSLGVRINLITLTSGVIAKTNTAYTSIETEFTYYTKTDASAAYAISLLAVCAALNAHDETYRAGMFNTYRREEIAFLGISANGNGGFAPDLGAIKAFESKNAN